MDPAFWFKRWENNEIGFHKSEVNPALVEHFDRLSIPKGSRVFVPLCGKTLDILWLLSQGYRVAGAELVELAVKQLFHQLGVEPTVSRVNEMTLYSAEGIDIFVGDIFDLSGDRLGPVDAVYDRAALVALPPDMRKRYSGHLMDISGRAPQLLVTFAYDQSEMDGPPFSVSNGEVKQHYGDDFILSLVASADVEGGLKGICPARENVWLLQPDGHGES